MAENFIYKVAGDAAALVLSDDEFVIDGQRIIGHQSGIARANFANKMAKQSSFISEIIAQFIVDYAVVDVQDDQAVSLVVDNFADAITNMLALPSSRRINKTQGASPYTVTAADVDGRVLFTNTGSVGETIFQLPAGQDGYLAKALVTSAQYLQIKAASPSTIRFLGGQTAVAGKVRSNAVGNTIEIIWSGTEWVIVGLGGPWNYDE